MRGRGRSSGYTLVELVFVITILAVIAAAVASRYVGLRTEATQAAVRGALGSLRSMSALVQAKARVSNVDTGTIDALGTAVPVHGGYAIGIWTGGIRELLDFNDPTAEIAPATTCSGAPLCAAGGQTSLPGIGAVGGQAVLIWPRGHAATDECYAWYHNPEDGTPAQTGTRLLGC